MPHAASRGADRRIQPTSIWLCLAWVLFWLGAPYLGHLGLQGRRAPDAPTSTAIARPRTLAPHALTAYFTDETHQFTGNDIERFSSTLEQFEKETSNQIAVAIYAATPDTPIEDFTIQTAALSRLGRKGLDNGAILFVFPDARVARLEVGYGLEPVLNDAKAGVILDQSLVPAWSRGERAEAVDATLAVLFDNVREGQRAGRMPGVVSVFLRQLAVELPRFAKDAWPVVRDLDLETRFVIALIGSLIVMGMFDGLLQAIALLRDLGRGTVNLVARRPLMKGVKSAEVGSLLDSVKVLVIVACALVYLVGVVVVAGGGAFGGAGAIRHW